MGSGNDCDIGSELPISPQPGLLPAGLFAQGDGVLMEVISFLCANLRLPGLFAGPFSCLNKTSQSAATVRYSCIGPPYLPL
jgi:hypothetical protein